MTRISLYALIPCVLVSLVFGTAYLDLCLLTVVFAAVINLIRKRSVAASVLMLAFTVISAISCGNTFALSNKSFYPLLEEAVTLKCVVDETPAIDADGGSFTAVMVSALHHGEEIALDGKVTVHLNGGDISLSYGDLIEFKTRLTLPSESLYAGGFSYRSYLRSMGVHIVCTAYDFATVNHGTYEGVNPVTHKIFRLRRSLLEKCDQYFNGDTAAFIKALLLGYSSDISENMSDNIRRAGISHVIAVSGMHLSILMIIINAFIRRLKFSGSVIVAPVLSILCTLFITALTGFSPSVKRAAIMLIISNSASIFRRENDSLQSLSFAIVILLLANPFAILDVRLALSASAVLGIILLSPVISRALGRLIKIGALREIIVITLAAQIFTAPLSVIFFNTISVTGVVTNLLVIPIIPYLMGTGVLFLFMSFQPLAEFLSDGMWLAVNAITKAAELVSSIPFAQVEVGFAKFIYITVLAAVAVYLIKKTVGCEKRGRSVAYFCISCAATVLIFFPPVAGDMDITAINVGQGDCTLIELPGGKTMLIDGGGGLAEDYDVAERIIRPYLIEHGISKIDYAVISHFHSDHAEGILNLAESFPIGCIIAPDYLKGDGSGIVERLFDICKSRRIPLYLMDRGDTLTPEKDVSLTVYSPDFPYVYNDNDASLVFKISAFGRSLLFTGDIEYYGRRMLARNPQEIQADILKAPHHGDYTIADAELLQAVNPDTVYVCVGANNTYGHPSEETVELYADRGINVLRTDIDGTLKFKIKRNGKLSIS